MGLILCAEKGTAEAHYALDNLPNKVVAAEYQMVLPEERLIVDELKRSGIQLAQRNVGRRASASEKSAIRSKRIADSHDAS